jgi:hypothetical protein
MNTPSFVDGYHDEIQSFQLWLWLLLLMWFNGERWQISMLKVAQMVPLLSPLFSTWTAAAVDPVVIYSGRTQPELQNEVGFSFWGWILTKQQRKWWEQISMLKVAQMVPLLSPLFSTWTAAAIDPEWFILEELNQSFKMRLVSVDKTITNFNVFVKPLNRP